MAAANEMTATIKQLLKTALMPVGKTMYVWGGGWDAKDHGASKETRTLGLSPSWEAFFKEQKEDYDFRKITGQRDKGLDCAGYIGWILYNIFQKENGKNGYVMKSTEMAKDFALRGWGTYRENRSKKIKNGEGEETGYLPGDIMSMPGHVFMVLGECRDKSVMLLHASPPGVQISGTPDPRGSQNSRAVILAGQCMKEHYPNWYEKYGHTMESKDYLPKADRMCWDVSGSGVMSDPEGYREMTAEELLSKLW